ncbi:polysaccharide biosynthesis protein, partial [Micromonospora sp. 067-2]|uniref:polysaccharide biosynthesis protein n=1 Tax=Micromonospora sp. 067-2 TaxID=2789270 RepID=UPI00397D8FBB
MTFSAAGRRVLITGGTGSFGRTMVGRLLDRDVGEVRVLSRDEAKQDVMRRVLGDERVRYYVGDVRDYDSVVRACRGVDFVFHAAALKQVPSCEFFPLEAVRTNVLGSANVVEAAERSGVSSVV